MDAPPWLGLDMEPLMLVFHSLWIMQCNTARADSIIHIGKEPRGGVGGGGAHPLISAAQVLKLTCTRCCSNMCTGKVTC